MPVPIVTIFGGSGFIGRYVTQRMARAGWRVRVAVRRPSEAGFVRPYGVVGQVEPIQANIRDEASTRAAIAGSQAVVNCVGVLAESGRQSFDALLDKGPGLIARLCAEEGVGALVHVSAIGAHPASASLYAAAKGRGEAGVRAAFPGAVILRPSIVFGTDDSFFNRFGAMARLSPVLPLVGPDTRFQPVYVDDVAAAAVGGATGAVAAGLFELGGPEVATFRELMTRLLAIVQRRRMLVTIPFGLARVQASILDFVQRASGGLISNGLLTRDQVRLLAHDNVADHGLPGLEAFGIDPTPMSAILESYLYAYRPHGQFDAMTASAEDLRQEPSASQARNLILASSFLDAALLGILEGFTEFIPVSSTGHILLAGYFLDFHSTGKAFEVLIQLGAILAILLVYAHRLLAVAAAAPHDPAARRFIAGILIAFLPAAVAGALLHDFIKTVLFETPTLIAVMLIVGGVVLLWVDRRPERPVWHNAMQFPLPMAFKIGLFQCLALVPGVSRSGATIVGALLLGADKRAAAEFSFFLSMPTMVGAFAFDLYKNRDVLSFDDAAVIAVGFVAAFVAALFVVRRLLDFVSRRGYAIFGWWRIIVGVVTLAALWIGYR